MALNWAVPTEMAGSRMTAARVTCGAICLSSSSHLPLKLYSQFMKPVMLPPGRDRLSTKPAPTGSATPANTIGKGDMQQCRHADGERMRRIGVLMTLAADDFRSFPSRNRRTLTIVHSKKGAVWRLPADSPTPEIERIARHAPRSGRL